MAGEGSISFERANMVIAELKRVGKAVDKAAMDGMQKAALNIIADAKTNLRANSSVVTGLLRASGRVQKTEDGDLDVGFFDTRNGSSGYAYYVEYGRRSGKMPPVDELEQWFYKKHRVRDARVRRAMAWSMAKRIAKFGTRPHPFFVPAVEANKEKINQSISDAIRQII